MRAKLVFVNGPEDGREIEVPLPAAFGRLPESEVPIPFDLLASRRHACLRAEKGEVILEDLGSRNGTYFLTGEPLKEKTVIDRGTLFRVGGVWFCFLGTEE